jgi:hypothetical protein
MNTPTPTPRTNAAIDLYAKQRTDSFLKSGNVGIGVMWVNYAHELEHELTRLRAELAIAENWVEHHSKHADDLIGENVRLRAELERFTGHGLLDCHAICDQRDAAVAERDRLRAEVERLKGALALGQQNCDDAYDDLREERDEAIARAEKAEAELADWSVLKGWGGTPEIIHKFIKGQQNRIHHCQDLEAELITERARLDYLDLQMGMPQVSEALNLPFSQCFPIRDAIDRAMKNETKTP